MEKIKSNNCSTNIIYTTSMGNNVINLETDSRQSIAAAFTAALIRMPEARHMTKRQLVDNAIAYADMLLRRLQEIPVDAQKRSEEGQKRSE